MKQSRIREWEENNGLIILIGHLFVEKKQEKLKTQGRDTSQKFKSKLVVIRRNIQYFFNGTIRSKVLGKFRIKEFSENLFTSQTIQKK